ncbi:MAG: radical SAM protein [Spirochaetota bacterium]
MKICLINPPQLVSISYERPYIFQPLGLLYIAASLERKYKVSVLDAALEGWRNLKIVNGKYHLGLSFDEIRNRIERLKPDIVGISVPFSINATSAHLVCEQVKKINKNIITIVGGPHPTVHPLQVLSDDNVDFVVMGEGEETILELVKALADNKTNIFPEILGIGFKKKGKLLINPLRPFIDDLDSIPFPARHLVPMKEYFIAMSSGGGARTLYTYDNSWVTIITSRGCPFNCNFCSINLSMGKKFRTRTPENVIKEIKQVLADYNTGHINFEDDNLTLNKARAKRIFDLIVNNKLEFTWSTPNGIRADTLDEELVSKMKKSGCVRVFVAPESGDQNVVDNIIGKKQDLKKVNEAVKMFKKYNIIVDGSFVLGSIGETKWNVLKTIIFAKKLKRAGMNTAGFHMATPYYGTPLYEEAKMKGFLREERDDLFSTKEPLISTPLLSSRTLFILYNFANWYVNLNIYKKIRYIIFRFLPITKIIVRSLKMLFKFINSILSYCLKVFIESFGLIKQSIRYSRMKKRDELLNIENIVYEVTDACNSRCKHCNMWKNSPSKNMLTPAELEKILKQDIFSSLKVILLTGGEAVLRKDIKELILAIHNARPNTSITLSTNAILADKVLEVARFCIENNILIDYGVSLDGIGEDHNLSRGIKNNFEKVDYLLKELVKLKELYKERMGNMLIGHTLSNLTVDTLQDVENYSEKLCISFVTQLYEQFSYYNNIDDKSKAKDYKKEDNQDLIKGLKALKPSFHNEILLAAVKHKLKYNCTALNSFFVLKPDGGVTPCLGFSHINIGNIKTNSVEEVWKSEEAKIARKQVEKCDGCSNSWATVWSFQNWPFPFIGMRVNLIIKKIIYKIKKYNKS